MRVGEWVVNLVEWCRRHAVPIVLGMLVLTGLFGYYAATTIGMDTNTDHLLSDKLPWRQREIAYRKAFPQQAESIIAVIDADIPEHAAMAASALVGLLKTNRTLFRSVRDFIELFFAHHVNRSLHQIADHRFHVASYIANFRVF